MQQAFYNTTTFRNDINSNVATKPALPGKTVNGSAGLVRWIARKWDLVGVLALIGSSAAYGVYALAHTGL